MGFVCFVTCSVIGSVASIYVGLNGDFDIISRGLIALNAFIPLLANIVIVCKMPVFYDIWKLRKEAQLCVIIQCVILTTFVLYSAIANPLPEHWTYLPFNTLGVMTYLLMNWIVFQWVFHQFELPWNVIKICRDNKNGIYQWNNINTADDIKNAQKQQQKSIGKYLTFSDEQNMERIAMHNNSSFEKEVRKRRDSISAISTAENKDKLSIRGILQDENGIILFARHLGTEFALENLLFFIETQQFLDDLHSHPFYHRQIKALHTEACGLSVYDHHQHRNSSHNIHNHSQRSSIPKFANHASNSLTGSHSPNNSPIGRDTDFPIITSHPGPEAIRPQSSSLSYQSMSHHSSFIHNDSKYIHLIFPNNVPRSRIISSGYRKKLLHVHRRKVYSKPITTHNNSNIKSTPTMQENTPISLLNDDRDVGNETGDEKEDSQLRIPLPLQNNSTGKSRSRSNTPNLSTTITPHQTPKKSPHRDAMQHALQLTALDSDKQYTRDDYQMEKNTDLGDISRENELLHEPLPLENNDTRSNTFSATHPIQSRGGINISATSKTLTRSATKSTSKSMTNTNTNTNTNNTLNSKNTVISSTISGGSFPDTSIEMVESEEIHKLEPYDQAVLLYRKYIAENSQFWINISHGVRAKLVDMFHCDDTVYQYDEERKHYIKIYKFQDDDSSEEEEAKYDRNKPKPRTSRDDIKNRDKIDIHDLYHCFDASRSEICFLLNGSSERFKLTGAFQEYLNKSGVFKNS